MECGEQCVIIITGITMMPELCADNWDMMSTLVEVVKLEDGAVARNFYGYTILSWLLFKDV